MKLLIIFFVLLFITHGLLSNLSKRSSQIQMRIRQLEHHHEEESSFLFRDFVVRQYRSLYRPLTRLLPQSILERTSIMLERAGNPWHLSAEVFVLATLGGSVLMFALSFGLLSSSGHVMKGFEFGLMAAGLAFVYPTAFLKKKAKQKIDQFNRAIPDFFDMITVSIEAGLALDGAIAKVCEQSNSPLADEFRATLEAMRYGRSRREAFSDLRERVKSEEFHGLIGAILQADMFGMPMTSVLRSQTKRIREIKRLAAREKAMKAPVKMLIPMVIFIFPVMFIILLGPVAVQIIQQGL